MLSEILQSNQDRFANIFDFEMTQSNALSLDFTKGNPSISHEVIYDPVAQEQFILEQLDRAHAQVGVGGYLEIRSLYTRSTIFDNENDSRTIHLGIDLWITSGAASRCGRNDDFYSLRR